MTDTAQTIQYLSDKDLRSLFDDNIVQFGGKTIQPGKQKLSKKWSVAKKIDGNGCAKYIFARPVSKWSKKHGHLEVYVDEQCVIKSDDELKITKEAQKDLIDHMHMLDVVVQRGKKGADPKSCLPKQNQAIRLLGKHFNKDQHSVEAIKKQLEGADNKDNSKYINFVDNSKKAWDEYIKSTNKSVLFGSENGLKEAVQSGDNVNVEDKRLVSSIAQYVKFEDQQVFEEDRLRYKSLVIKKKIGEIFGSLANAFSGVIEPAKKILATLRKNPNTTCVAIAAVCLLWNAPYAIVRLIGYAIDSIKNKILEIDTSQPPKDSLRAKVVLPIVKFLQEHKRVSEVIAATIRIGVQSVVAFIGLAVNPVYMVQTLIDLAVNVVRNLIPPLGRWIEKHPIITQIVVTTITLATQLTVGFFTGSLPLAIFTAVLTLGTQIMVSDYGQSIIGWCIDKIFGGEKKENNVVLTVKEQKRIDKAKECIEKAKEPIGRVGNAVSNLIVGVYGTVNKLYSKTVSWVIEVVSGCHLENPEKPDGDTEGQKSTEVQMENRKDLPIDGLEQTEEIKEEIIKDDNNTNENVFIRGLLWLEEKLQHFADKYRSWAYTEVESEQQAAQQSGELNQPQEEVESLETTTDKTSSTVDVFGSVFDVVGQRLDNLEEKLQQLPQKINPTPNSSAQTNAAMSQIVKDVIPVVANIVEDANK